MFSLNVLSQCTEPLRKRDKSVSDLQELENIHRDKRLRGTETLWDNEALIKNHKVNILEYEERVDTLDLFLGGFIDVHRCSLISHRRAFIARCL